MPNNPKPVILTQEGEQIFPLTDASLVTGLSTALSGKQDTISDLSTIRANATSAYQKPSTGIPKSDLDSGVKASLELADSAIQPAEFNELEEEVGTIGNGAYEEAWDGSSAPAVADIPAGVSVTYSDTSYTGTLAASASTVDKIYLVSDGNGNYDRYVTVESGGTYSWKKVGTTAIPLSNYATKSEVDQLGQKSYGFIYNGGISTVGNWDGGGQYYKISEFIPIVGGEKIYGYSNATRTVVQFYDVNKTWISSMNPTDSAMNLVTLTPDIIPNNAVYFRAGTLAAYESQSYIHQYEINALEKLVSYIPTIPRTIEQAKTVDEILSSTVYAATSSHLDLNVYLPYTSAYVMVKMETPPSQSFSIGRRSNYTTEVSAYLTDCHYNKWIRVDQSNDLKILYISDQDANVAVNTPITVIYKSLEESVVERVDILEAQSDVMDERLDGIDQILDDLSTQLPSYIENKGVNYTGLFDSVGGVTTIYVPVTPGVDVTIDFGGQNVTGAQIVKYASDGSYVDWNSQALTTKTVAIPNNVRFIRCSFVKTNIQNCSIKQSGVDIWSPSLSTATFVRTIVQYLTESEKEQARSNIGASAKSDTDNLARQVGDIEQKLATVISTISSTDYTIAANSPISQFVTIPKNRCAIRVNVDKTIWETVELHKVSGDHQTIEYAYVDIVPGIWYIVEKTEERPDILIYKSTTTSSQKPMNVEFADPDSAEYKLNSIAGESPLRIALFGDSLTEFTGDDKKSLAQWLEFKMNCVSFSLGIGGTRVSQRGAPTATPSTIYEAYAVFDLPNWVKTWADNDFTIADACNTYLAQQGDDNSKIITLAKAVRPADVDAVVIFQGTNDFTAEAQMGTASAPDDGTANNTVSGALKYAIKTLLTANPALKIYIFTPIVRYLSSPWTDSEFSDNKVINGIHLYDVEDVIAAAAKPYHIPVCKWYWTLGWNQTNFDQYFDAPDGTHPDGGYEYLAEKMAHFIGAN